MRIGLGLGVGRPRGRGNVSSVVYGAEAAALFSRMTTAPDSTRKGHINTLIASLKASGLWSKFDGLYMMAAHDAQAACLNWKANAFNLTPVGDPTFTVDRGYTGNGTSSYLSPGYDPTTAAGAFVQDSGALAVRLLNNIQDGIEVIGSNAGNSFIRPRTATDNVATRLNAAATTNTPGVTDAAALFVASRTSAAGFDVYRNAASLATVTAASAAPISAEFRILSGGAGRFSARQVAFAGISAGLTAGDVASLNTSLSAYLAAVGVAP